MAALKTIDDKGRLTVGRQYAGKLAAIEVDGDGFRISFRTAVPEREAWLWENDAARAKVEQGLKQMANGELGDGPDMAEALKFADSLPDE